MPVQTVFHDYHPRGAALELFKSNDVEVLLAGPADTGKSRGVGEYLLQLAEKHPGCRILACRKTRRALSESFQVTFENLVVPEGHPVLGGAKRSNRHSYDFQNGSTIVLGGLDEPMRYYSTEWDVVFVEEAIELTLEEWEPFLRSLRYQHISREPGPDGKPRYMHRLIGVCNPAHPMHWLKLRCEAGHCRMLISRHEDNPSFTPERREKLERMTGVRRLRLLLGQWAATEGMVWEWDELLNRVDLKDLPHDSQGGLKMDHYVAAVDWGFTNAGVIQVFGIDKDHRMYRVHEIYKARKSKAWWQGKGIDVNLRWKPVIFVCDPSSPGEIAEWRKAGLPAIEADNEVKVGLDAVRDRLAVAKDGKPRLMFVRDALEERDEELAEARMPTCFEEEIYSYCYPKGQDGKPIKEKPDPGCPNHACDATRYAVRYVDRYDHRPREVKPMFAEGTMGDWLGHEKVLNERTLR